MNKKSPIYVQIIIFLVCIELSISFPIVQNNDSKQIQDKQDTEIQENTIQIASTTTNPTFVKTSKNSPVLNKFVKNIIHSFDEDADQQLNIGELGKMLTNRTLLKKFENILNKKQSTFIHKLSNSVKSKEPKSSTHVSKTTTVTNESDLKIKENKNLKSNKKLKLQEEFQKEEDNFFNETSDDMQEEVFTYSGSKIANDEINTINIIMTLQNERKV